MDQDIKMSPITAEGTAHMEKSSEEVTAITSQFAHLTRRQCVRRFWRLYITVLSVSIGAM